MLELNRGEVIVVDLEGAKGAEVKNDQDSNCRVCLVVQNDRGNAVSPTTIVAPIKNGECKSPLPIIVNVSDDERGPLNKPSRIDLGQLRTLDRDIRIKKVLGPVPSSVMERVDEALRKSLGL